MKDILDYFSTWSALKWIVLVLVAGFIGQFGKMLAQTIVRKIRLARLKKENLSAIESPPTEDYSVPAEASAAKEQRAQSPAQDARIDKKVLKALVKQDKKEAKKNK